MGVKTISALQGPRDYRSGERAEGGLVESYVYQNAAKENYLRVDRYLTKDGKKQFPQFHWTGANWLPGANNLQRILYRLPELLATPRDQTIFICEGEKDANTVASLDLTATTAPEGAGKWRDTFNPILREFKHVVILADDDAPGQAHARQVARSLEVDTQIVFFPQKDVTDWVNHLLHTESWELPLHQTKIKERLFELVSAAPFFVPRATIRLGPEISQNVDEMQKALIQAGVPILVHLGVPVRPVFEDRISTNNRKTRISILREVPPGTFAYLLSKHAAVFEKYSKTEKAWVQTSPPERELQVLHKLGHWKFPTVSGLINSPSMRSDGTLITEPGYDAQTGYWYELDPNLTIPPIPDQITKEQAQDALQLLVDLLRGFPFATPTDRSVALAGILTTVLRGAFSTAPIFLWLAHQPGSGKSYLADTISAIALGKPSPLIGLPSTEEELEKRLSSVALEGGAMVLIDNCDRNIDSPFLCIMSSQSEFKPRILGTNSVPSCQWRGTIHLTGNNVTLEGDLTRRGLVCTLEPRTDAPQFRHFDFDPCERVLKDRGRYVAAALTIARAYFNHGQRLPHISPLANYGEWSRFVREPLIWLGESDPVSSMDSLVNADPKYERNNGLISYWYGVLGTAQVYRVRDVTARLRNSVDPLPNGENLHPDLREQEKEFWSFLMDQVPTFKRDDVDTKKLGNWLSQIKGQVHKLTGPGNIILGQFFLALVKSDSKHGSTWQLQQIKTGEPT